MPWRRLHFELRKLRIGRWNNLVAGQQPPNVKVDWATFIDEDEENELKAHPCAPPSEPRHDARPVWGSLRTNRPRAARQGWVRHLQDARRDGEGVGQQHDALRGGTAAGGRGSGGGGRLTGGLALAPGRMPVEEEVAAPEIAERERPGRARPGGGRDGGCTAGSSGTRQGGGGEPPRADRDLSM